MQGVFWRPSHSQGTWPVLPRLRFRLHGGCIWPAQRLVPVWEVPVGRSPWVMPAGSQSPGSPGSASQGVCAPSLSSAPVPTRLPPSAGPRSEPPAAKPVSPGLPARPPGDRPPGPSPPPDLQAAPQDPCAWRGLCHPHPLSPPSPLLVVEHLRAPDAQGALCEVSQPHACLFLCLLNCGGGLHRSFRPDQVCSAATRVNPTLCLALTRRSRWQAWHRPEEWTRQELGPALLRAGRLLSPGETWNSGGFPQTSGPAANMGLGHLPGWRETVGFLPGPGCCARRGLLSRGHGVLGAGPTAAGTCGPSWSRAGCW